MTTNEYERLLAELTPAAEKRLRFKHSLPHEDREDVLQESLVYLVRTMERGKVREPAALLASIIDTRAKNRALANKARREKESPTAVELTESLQDSVDEYGVFPYIEDTGKFSASDFDAAVRELDDELRDAFILLELRGVDRFEAAQLLGVPASTIQGRADRARNAIRKEL